MMDVFRLSAVARRRFVVGRPIRAFCTTPPPRVVTPLDFTANWPREPLTHSVVNELRNMGPVTGLLMGLYHLHTKSRWWRLEEIDLLQCIRMGKFCNAEIESETQTRLAILDLGIKHAKFEAELKLKKELRRRHLL